MDYAVVDGTNRTARRHLPAGGCRHLHLGPVGARPTSTPACSTGPGIELQYFDYAGYPEYPQLFPPFDHHVSVIDLIFNTGPRRAPITCDAPLTMRLSVVATLYRSAPHLEEFHARVSAAAAAVTDDYEIVLVNDGSPDDSLADRAGAAGCRPRLRIVDLSRNFGHHKAMMTGLAHARGDLVFLIDSDLEEDPELLPTFLRHR